MSEWVTESDISTKLGYKILIAGLSEAGKTAVKRIFFLKQQTKEVDRLSATINYERMSVSIKGTPITIVDLGGQKIFIKRFLNNFSPFIFSSVKNFIFLVDVANKTTRNNAIQYFSSCLKNLQKYSPQANLFVFLHKNDLVKRLPNYESIHAQLKEQFQLECSTRELCFFRTTIYKPKTVIDAFGRIFELTIPNLTNSEFTEGRTIGQIEEYSKEDMTLRKPVVDEDVSISSTKEFLKTAGDPEILNKLQVLMQQAMRPSINSIDTETSLYNEDNQANEEEKIEDLYTKHLEDLAIEPIESITTEPAVKTATLPVFKPTTPNERISQLVNFYNIKHDQATAIVDLGYDVVFELSAASGIRIPIVLKVLLKYIPFLKSKGLEVDALYHDRILDIFAAYIEGGIAERELIKFLIYAIERPMMPVKAIANLYFITPKMEALARKKEVTIPFERKEFTSVQIPIMIQTGIESGAIHLPALKDLRVHAEIVEFNAHLTFYSNGDLLSSSMVPDTISIDELKYLLAFEMSLHALGFFHETGLCSLNIAANIIHGLLQKLCDDNITTTSNLSIKGNFIELPLVLEVEVDGNRFVFPYNGDLYFKVEKIKQEVLIQFFKDEKVISEVMVHEDITIQELFIRISDLNLQSIPNDIMNFSAHIIHFIINNKL
ncbi:MAG: ADP-ribosylation factor-like protein [Promethearchaeota archaeon]